MQLQNYQAQICNLREFGLLGFDKLSSQAQTLESFTNLQCSQCNWDAMNLRRLSEFPSYTRVQVEGANLLQF